MRSWTRVRRKGAFGAHAQAFVLFSTVETRHCDAYPNRCVYISDTYQCARCLEVVPEVYPYRGTPPFDYSRIHCSIEIELNSFDAM